MGCNIHDVNDFFKNTINDFVLATNFVVLFDPENFLELGRTYVDKEHSKCWEVVHYQGNDLYLRSEFSPKNSPNKPTILWITKNNNQEIDLSFVYDIVERAEEFIDLSIEAILAEILPEVRIWPTELLEYSTEIGQNLSDFYSLYHKIKKELPVNVPLNSDHIHALIIALRNKQILLSDLVVSSCSSNRALEKYVKVIVSSNIDKETQSVFQRLVKNSLGNDFPKISGWLSIRSEDLSVFLYLMKVAKCCGLSRPEKKLQDLGLLAFDSETLGRENISMILESKELNQEIWNQIITLAETKLEPKQIKKIRDCSNFDIFAKIPEIIQNQRFPLFSYTLLVDYMRETLKKPEVTSAQLSWAQNLRNSPIIDGMISSAFSEKASAAASLIINLSTIYKIIETKVENQTELAPLVDFWKESGLFRVQLLSENISQGMNCFADEELKRTLDRTMLKIKSEIKTKLDILDANLFRIIEHSWRGYLSHPRLSINVIKDYVMKERMPFSIDRKVWILIFDGMRFDTWDEIVKPLIAKEYVVKEEKVYLSMLPSETDIARVALIAGSTPYEWKDYFGNYTSNHSVLASMFFRLSQAESFEKLKVTVGMETDVGQRRHDEGSYLYNILIYNLSDDLLHGFRDELQELNNHIRGTIERKILPDLRKRIKENDVVVLTSDHGFIELAPDEKISAFDVNQNPNQFNFQAKQIIAYRCMTNIDFKKGYKVSLPEEFYTLATGRKWFSRPGPGRSSRYAHGGISLDEMIVPGVLLQKITIPTFELSLNSPERIELTEDETKKVIFKLRNEGNSQGLFEISFKLNTGNEEIHKGTINPKNEVQIDYTFINAQQTLKKLEITIVQKLTNGTLVKTSKCVIPIKIDLRKDKVEFNYGGLDNILE